MERTERLVWGRPGVAVMKLPQGMAYGNWEFSIPTLSDLTFEIEIRGNANRMPGRYYQLYDGHIGGIGSYFGLQTNLARPGLGWQGHGLIFSRWGTRDPSYARAEANGWIENAGHEGDFVGVRVLTTWSTGKYRCQLKVIDSDPFGVWYQFGVLDCQTGMLHSAGSLRFPAAKINSGGGTWTEVYSGTRQESEIPETELRVVSVMANGDSLRPSRCRVCYQPQFASSDAFVEDGVLVLRSGSNVTRLHAPQTYTIDA